ncbi:potassium transporter [Peniophora sp. CONT]|nr:potassium transporter [Peniophora sp. CONT]
MSEKHSSSEVAIDVEDKRGMQRKAVHASGWLLATMSFQALGIIHSDIGTSPLYVLNGIWPASGAAPVKEDIIGGLSAIIWSLTLVPLCKYVLVCLRFGTTEGEGGTFALFQGLYPCAAFESAPTYDSMVANGQIPRQRRRTPKNLRWTLLIWSLLGTSLTMADGVLTAAVSVTSAVGGIAVAKESVTNDIVPISIAFLIALFIAQPFGTSRLGFSFAPITCVWILLLGITGIINITSSPGIFRAFDPSRAILWFVRTKNYDALSGVLLAVTGCEALFANLGQFNALSIQVSFAGFVYPALVLAYLGQGAKLISDGENVITNVFYTSVPGGTGSPMFWVMYVFAILATLIASQTMITATFSLVQQLINSKSFIPLRMHHTSDKNQGQVYIPAANWILMIGTIVMVAAFKNLTQLTNAYGFAVSTVMFTTTALVAMQVVYVKQRPVVLALLLFGFFGFVDALFWGASLRKVPEGAWVPLMIGLILLAVMVFWNWAKGLEDAFDSRNRRQLHDFIVGKDDAVFDGKVRHDIIDDEAIVEHEVETEESDTATLYCLPTDAPSGNEKNVEGRRELGRVPLFAIFHRMANEKGVPHSFTRFISQWPALPTFAVFLTVQVLPVAHVTTADRYVVNKLYALPGFYGATYYLGYRDDFVIEVPEVAEKIKELETRLNPHATSDLESQLAVLSASHTHIVPYYAILNKPVGQSKLALVVNYVRAFLIEDVYARARMMFPETINWIASPDRIIRIGVTARI